MSEDEVRKALEKQLGVEFYDPDDPEVNVDVERTQPVEAPVASGQPVFEQISVASLIAQCNTAVRDESNKYRHLIWNCAFALKQLTDHIAGLERGEQGGES
jgi:D-aminopeptidase